MKKFLAVILIMAAAAWLRAEKLAVIEDIMKPSAMTVAKGHVYVVEFPTVYVYSRADWTLVKKFGKAGEGPKEFNNFVILRVVKDRLLVNSLGKVTYYTLDGEYIEEKRVNFASGVNLLPLGKDRFVARGFGREGDKQFASVNLLDGEGKKLKELGRMPAGFQGGQLKILDQNMNYETDGERIYVMIGREFVIDVFDREGEKISTITRDYERPKFTDKDREIILEEVRTDPRQKQFFDMVKERAVFPDYWPAIASTFIQGDKIFVMTFKRIDDSYELFALKLDGTLVSRKMIPLKFQTALRPFPTDVKGGKLYQLIENDDEEWELHAWDL